MTVLDRFAVVLAVAAVIGAVPAVSAAGAPAATCDGKTATIVGTSGNDVLTGTPGNDVIVGLAGDDRIHALDGNDLLCGGGGLDRLYGDDGSDRLYGGNDRIRVDRFGRLHQHGDALTGGAGNDYLSAGRDPRVGDSSRFALPSRSDTYAFPDTGGRNETIDLRAGTARGAGHDTMVWYPHSYVRQLLVRTGAGDDRVLGSSYGDDIETKGGSDFVDGRGGNDFLLASENPPRRGGGPDNDVIHGGSGDDEIVLGLGTDRAFGGTGDDTMRGQTDTNATLRGDGGNDKITIALYARVTKTVDGGPGRHDSIRFVHEFHPDAAGRRAVRWNMGNGKVLVTARHPGVFAVARNFEVARLARSSTWAVFGTAADEHINAIDADGAVTRFYGRGGNDRFGGSSAGDYFNGGAGHDTATMREGTDTCASVSNAHSPAASCEVIK